MFEDLFNFGKKRTPKQAVGFFLFHGGLLLVVMAIMKVAGLA